MADKERKLEDAQGTIPIGDYGPSVGMEMSPSGYGSLYQVQAPNPLEARISSKPSNPMAIKPKKPEFHALASQAMSTGPRSQKAVKTLAEQADEMLAQVKAENAARANMAPAVQPTLSRDYENDPSNWDPRR